MSATPRGCWGLDHEGSDDAREEPETVRVVLGVLDHGFPLMMPVAFERAAARGLRHGLFEVPRWARNAMCTASHIPTSTQGTCKASSCNVAAPREGSRDTRTCLVFAHLNRYTARFIAGGCRIARAVVGQVLWRP